MPKHIRHEAVVPESILTSDGRKETIMLHAGYAPYKKHASSIANICGSFTEMTLMNSPTSTLIMEVVNSFGKQREIFSVYGNVTLNRGKASFMGARGMDCLIRLAEHLSLSSARNSVYMVVICARIGERVQVRPGGLLETKILTHFSRHIKVEHCGIDITNTVKLAVTKFSDPVEGGTEPEQQRIFALDRRFRPTKNSWSITGKGTIHIRLSWDSVEWSQECEDACKAWCDRVIQRCIVSV